MSDLARLTTVELVSLCAQQGSQAEWDEFVRRFHPTIASVVIRRARTWGETRMDVFAELIQDTYLKLCAEQRRLLREFHPEHPEAFYGYLKIVASNLVNDHFKAAHAGKRGSGAEAVALEESDHAGAQPWRPVMSATDRDLLLRELDCMLQEATQGETAQRDRTIFWLYYRTGSPPNINTSPTTFLRTWPP